MVSAMNAAKKKSPVGRPKSKVTSKNRITFVATDDERQELERLAKAAGLGLSAYIRSKLFAHLAGIC